MSSPRFSIVVPCYNVVQYLDECLDSVARQTFADFEVLLVNDGSTDGTLALCRKRASSDSRIRVIDKENGGLSDARNRGMEECRGEYLVFLDSDDFIEPAALEEINRAMNAQTEILVTRWMDNVGDEVVVHDAGMEEFFSSDRSLEAMLTWVFRKTKVSWPAQKYIVSREYARRNDLSFLKGVLHEDIDWTPRLFAHARHVDVCFFPWYHHRLQREGAITNVVKAKRITDVIRIAHGLLEGDRAVISSYDEPVRSMVVRRIMISVFQNLGLYKKLATRKEKNEALACAKQYASILRNQPKLKFRVLMKLADIFGLRLVLDMYSALPFD